MEEFAVDERGCREMSTDMLKELKDIVGLVDEIDSQDGTLRAALGEDYESIAKSVRIMKGALVDAQAELNVIIRAMNEYMAQVQQVRITLG